MSVVTVDTVDIVEYIDHMNTLRVYVWKGQGPVIAAFARQNREALIEAGTWDGVGEPPRSDEAPATVEAVIEAALRWWVAEGYPEDDWTSIANRPEGWGPTAGESSLLTIATDDVHVLSTVTSLKESRAWLGKGSRIKNAVPSRATLAIVGTYMATHRGPHHDELEYPNDSSSD